jgi:hypothetical protein
MLEAVAHSLVEHMPIFLDKASGGSGMRVRRGRIPVKIPVHAGLGKTNNLTWKNAADLIEMASSIDVPNAARRERQATFVDTKRPNKRPKAGRHGCEGGGSRCLGIEQRRLAGRIARQCEQSAVGVEDCDRKIPRDPAEAGFATLLPELQKEIGVGQAFVGADALGQLIPIVEARISDK